MAKATHLGTCQWCGRRQMLPGGVLAKHGYDLAHGFMRGVCMGSGHLPYEQSTDLIEKSIAWAAAEAARLRHSAKAQREITGSLECHRHTYRADLSSRSRGSVYLWTAGRIVGDGFDARFVWTTGGTEKSDRLHRGPGARGEAIASEFRHEYAKALEAAAAREDTYADSQRRRIESWQPQELQPRAA